MNVADFSLLQHCLKLLSSEKVVDPSLKQSPLWTYLREAIKELYNSLLGQAQEKEEAENCFQELLLTGFDAEQLWSQTEALSALISQLQKHQFSQLQKSFQLLSEEMLQKIDAELKRTESMELADQEAEKESTAEGNEGEVHGAGEMGEAFLNFDEMQDFVDEGEEEDKFEEDRDLLGSLSEKDPVEDDVDEENTTLEEHKEGNEIMYNDFYQPTVPKTNEVTNQAKPNADAVEDKEMSRAEQDRVTLKKEIKDLEEEAVAEKEWPFRGEIVGKDRPMNSALEVDLDYETNVRPPPKPTQAHLDSIENLIKQRIAERQFDDVARVVPPPIEESKKVMELDDNKAKKGLGESYEEQYVERNWGEGTLEEKEDKLRNEARKLFKEASLQLDALTHFHFAPRPIVEEIKVKSNAAAVIMEDPVPMAVNTNTLKAPEEIFSSKTGEKTNEKEWTKEEKKRIRAKRKQRSKSLLKEDPEMTSKNTSSRKSLVHRQAEAGQKRRKLSEKKKSKSTVHTGSSVFRKIQSLQTLNTIKKSSVKGRGRSVELKL